MFAYFVIVCIVNIPQVEFSKNDETDFSYLRVSTNAQLYNLDQILSIIFLKSLQMSNSYCFLLCSGMSFVFIKWCVSKDVMGGHG